VGDVGCVRCLPTARPHTHAVGRDCGVLLIVMHAFKPAASVPRHVKACAWYDSMTASSRTEAVQVHTVAFIVLDISSQQ
jgi:hypothetical protein